MSAFVSRLIEANVRDSQRLARQLSLASDKPFWDEFGHRVVGEMRQLQRGATVIDLGGGRRCVYAPHAPADRELRLVAVDISEEELEANKDVAERVVADVTEGIPIPESSVDLLVSRALLEHVTDVAAASASMARVLRPGGVALHFVPGRYSLFGLAARMLPFGPLLRLLHVVRPQTRGQVEFEVHYDRCHPAAMEQTFRAAGFRQVTVDVCWAQPGYFEAVFPLFLVTSAYEWLVAQLGLRRLASYMIVRAER